MRLKNYYPRICDKQIESLLSTSGALLIEGPKWCGKTWAGLNASNSVLYMQQPDSREGYMRMADTMPSLLLDGEKPRLIDEWQEAPILWDAVRFDVDQTGLWGQYILTGSATPRDDKKPMHTGTGRFTRLRMRPMSLYESRESTGAVSLEELFNGQTDVSGRSELTIPQIAGAICRGGWPEAVVKKISSGQTARNYIETVVDSEIPNSDGINRNPHRVRQLLMSYARNISTMAAHTTILADMRSNDVTVSDTTIYNYSNALRRIFLIEDIPAWMPSLRSKTAMRTSEKRQFVDPSIAAAALRADANGILNDFEYFGQLFESLAARDLRVYSQNIGGEIFHYRDKDGLEIDLVIRLYDGRWAGVEVKLGSREIEYGANHLVTFKNKIDTEKVGNPAFLMVVTGGEFAYRRKDGVFVVPLACLKD